MDFINDEEKMRDFYELSKEEFLNSYSYLTENDYEATIKALNDTNEIFKFKDKEYNLKVSTYENTKLLKVLTIDRETKEEKEITKDGVELVIPPAPTPDCVLVDSENDKEIIDKLLENKILDYCNVMFAKFNMEELYKYDKVGTMEYLKIHAHFVEYEKDKGNSLEEVKEKIQDEVKSLLGQKETEEFLWDKHLISNPKNLSEIYVLVNSKNPKNSVVVMYDTNTEKFCFIKPYMKKLEDKISSLEEWRFNYEEHLFEYLENDYQMFNSNDFVVHYNVWNYIEEMYPEEIENKKGMQNYLKYCKENGITKTKIENEVKCDVPDVMKLYKDKTKRKDDR